MCEEHPIFIRPHYTLFIRSSLYVSLHQTFTVLSSSDPHATTTCLHQTFTVLSLSDLHCTLFIRPSLHSLHPTFTVLSSSDPHTTTTCLHQTFTILKYIAIAKLTKSHNMIWVRQNCILIDMLKLYS